MTGLCADLRHALFTVCWCAPVPFQGDDTLPAYFASRADNGVGEVSGGDAAHHSMKVVFCASFRHILL